MNLIVFSKNFDFAAKIIVWTLDELKLTNFPMFFKILSLNFVTAFVIAFNNFIEAPVIMSLKIFMNYDSLTTGILALYSSVMAVDFVLVHLPSFHFDCATFFK